MPFRPVLLLLTLCLSACAAGPGIPGRPAVAPWGLDLSMIDRGVAPGDDFYSHANGGWQKTAQIPADRAHAGVNHELDRRTEAHLKALVTEIAATPRAALAPVARKLQDLYTSYVDTAAIEARGMAPARADLAMIAGLSSHTQVAEAMHDPALRLDGPYAAYLDADDKRPDIYTLRLLQSGLGMPDRDYYLRDDDELLKARTAYVAYLRSMLGHAGVAAAETGPRAQAVYALETALAQAHWPAADRRDADKTYNRRSVSELIALAPEYPWRAAFARSGLPATGPQGERQVIVTELSAFAPLARVFAATPVAVWRDYLAVRYLHAHAAVLPRAVDDADFAFHGTVVQGNTQQLDRVTRGIHLLDATLGEALGQLFVERHFPAAAKAKAELLVSNLLKSYDADLRTLAWMGEATRAQALAKLRKIRVKVGYPARWRDYGALDIRRDDLLGSLKNAAAFEWRRQMARIDEPVDREEWGMTPPTNNAYYHATLNEIVFPAGILQPPFFDPAADDAVNYGGIGATIGHEISHGFDDQGSKYDAEGRLRDWWTAEDRRNFDARTQRLAEQFNRYEPLPGLRINGQLTLGENIADLAGVVIAYKAYQLSLGGRPAPVLDGLTGDQRFYLAYAQSWRQKDREGRLRAQLLSNPHAPPLYRVNGCLPNDDGWYAAFGVGPKHRHYIAPADRVRLW
jgi:putative endopeptidase